MSVAHLVGRRTGRPRGSRTRPPWERDVRWAYGQLRREHHASTTNGEGNATDGVNNGKGSNPPSPVAVMLLEMGRQHPDRLVMLLMQLDGAAQQQAVAPAEAAPEEPARPRRVKTITLPRSFLVQWAFRDGAVPWPDGLPESVAVEGITLHPKQKAVTLTIRSEEFEPVAEGAPVPHVELPQGC